MKPQDLYAFRRECIAVAASFRPELEKDFERMDALYAATAEKAAIIGTAEDAAKLKADAETYADKAREEAAAIVAEAELQKQENEEVLQTLREREAKIVEQEEIVRKARLALEEAIQDHKRKVAADADTQAGIAAKNDVKAADLTKREQAVTGREEEVKRRLKKMQELAA